VKHVISFSGGMGSFAEAKACVDKFGKENVTLLFADTMMEDDDLYRFKDECVAFLDCELVTLADGRTPFEVFKDVKFMGNSVVDPCSRILKREPLIKWFITNYSVDEAHMHLGIDYSEGHRLVGVQKRMVPYIYRSTLVEDGRIIHKDFSEQFGIKRPRLYEWKLGHNNCGGFCIKAGLGHYKALYETIGSVYPFLKKTENKVLRRLTLKRYREEYLEPRLVSLEDSQEYGGCGCAI
jgi:hypothetical protein